MSKTDDLKNRTLSIKKTFQAPVEVVWDAWTQADHIIKWWAPPGMPVEVIEHDFRVGGNWKYTMMMPNQMEFISEGTYLEITEYKKIVTSAHFMPMTENVELHITFEQEGARTHFEFSVVHESEAYAQSQEKMGFYNGWGSALARLEEFLENK